MSRATQAAGGRVLTSHPQSTTLSHMAKPITLLLVQFLGRLPYLENKNTANVGVGSSLYTCSYHLSEVY